MEIIDKLNISNFFENSSVQEENDCLINIFENEIKEIDADINIDKIFENSFDISFDSSISEKEPSIENKINEDRKKYLETKVTYQLIEIILDESFEFGIKSKSEILIEEQLKINELATRNWLNEIFIDYFDDEKILIGILRIIGRFAEQIIFPQGQTMALAALNHKNPEIKELGIRAFENWGTLNSIKILESIELNIEWLSEYKNQVINDLKEELYVSNP
ncbi:MAG: hypothetical protein ACTSXT_09570 [Candidatus Helarchaeota archaeon]